MWLTEAGISQRQVHELTGVSRDTIRKKTNRSGGTAHGKARSEPMAERSNFLIGYGERLASDLAAPVGGAPKTTPLLVR